MEVIDIPDTYQQYSPSSSSYGYYSGYENMNNILIFNSKDEVSYPVFDRRVSIIDYIVYSIANKKYLFLVLCENDSNNDGYLNKNDLLSLYSYDIYSKEMKRINKKDEFILHSYRLENSDKIIIEIGIDRNNDNKFIPENEPMVFKQFNIITHDYTQLINNEIIQNLQNILDGK